MNKTPSSGKYGNSILGLVMFGFVLLVTLLNFLSASYLGVYAPFIFVLLPTPALLGAWIAVTNRTFEDPTEAPIWWKAIAYIASTSGLIIGIYLWVNVEYFVEQTEHCLRFLNLYDPFGLRHP